MKFLLIFHFNLYTILVVIKLIKKKNNNNLNVKNIISEKKLKISLIIAIFLFILLIARLFYLQILDGNYLSNLALTQQSSSEIIHSKRGNIYDATGASLAISEPVDTISINPKKFKKDTKKETEEYKELVAKGLSDIFDLDYKETLKKINSDSSSVTIVEKIEEDKVNELKQWMKDNKATAGINIDEDAKRSYPYNTLASQVIGVCGTDNQGLSGIEYSYDSILTGTSGQIVTSIDGSQSEIPNSVESFVEAEDGYNLTLTLDVNIQNIVEKYLEKAVNEFKCNRGGNCVVMNPNTGDILAMASYPYYNLNEPYVATSYYNKDWDKLSKDEKLSRIYEMWKVRSVSETYEPGSVFKLITASVALEENITTADKKNDFNCSGAETVEDRVIKCWRHYQPHGNESLRDAIVNSCNPALIQLSKRIGSKTLYKYYDSFGFFTKTNIGLSGEASGIFHDLSDVGPVELATMSFGQRFTITPLQMCTAISAIANGGYLIQPKLVKSMENTDTGETTEMETTKVRQVLSSQTSQTMKDIMKSTVDAAKSSQVKGYSVGGKSGTSEPTNGNPDAGYVASFTEIAPVDNPQVVVLLTLYDPTKKSYQGSQTAGPTVAKILSEVLPYLGIEPNNK